MQLREKYSILKKQTLSRAQKDLENKNTANLEAELKEIEAQITEKRLSEGDEFGTLSLKESKL